MKRRENCGIGSRFRYFPSRRRGSARRVHVYRFRKRATPRCIILQLVNSCPHPVSGASCVPLSPSPFFLLFSPILFLPPLRCPALSPSPPLLPTDREMPYGPGESGTKMVDRCILDLCCAPNAFVARASSSSLPFLPH